jgi:3-oxoacyl-[acyl-carrier protein] reductase
MSSLSGKIALVTGASRGIGAAIARRLASDGATVVVNYVTSAKAADAVVAQITSAGGSASAIQGNVSDAGQVRRLFDAIHKAHGRVDIVVNNAGVYAEAPLAEATVEHYRHVFDINVQGTILVSAEALKHFPKTGGRIINFSSVLAQGAAPNASVYGASKAAVEALTRYWAADLGSRHITVNAVAPGLTDTDMAAHVPPEIKNVIVSRTPLGQLGRAEDIADVVAFLASDNGRWITGHTITASGGLRA